MFKVVVVLCLRGFCTISEGGLTVDTLEECLVGVTLNKEGAEASAKAKDVEFHAFCVQASDLEGGLRILGKDYRPWFNPDSR